MSSSMVRKNRSHSKTRRASKVRVASCSRCGPSLIRNHSIETVSRVRDYILSDPDILNDKSKWVEGWGWDHTRWILEQWPTSVGRSDVPPVRF